MNSAKGFLAPRGEGEPLRITARQKGLVVRTIHAAFDRLGPSDDERHHSSERARGMAVHAIDAYPVDRSCITCDFSMGDPDVYCQHWKQEVPDANVESGCDNHQDDGAPF